MDRPVIGRVGRPAASLALAVLLGGFLLADRAPQATAQDHPLSPYLVGYEGGDDVHSANARGEDQRALSGPDRGEAQPAYSPDGTRIAYVQWGVEAPPSSATPSSATPSPAPGPPVTGFAGLVVANADGTSPRVLNPGIGGAEPTWSPDGTKLAVTTEAGIRVLRVADGAVLADVPAPPTLSARDSEPAWSPDGTTIAFTRRIDGQETPSTGPYAVVGGTSPGGDYRTGVSLTTDEVPNNPDIVFLLDNTGSMGGYIQDAKAKLTGVLARISQLQPQARYGLATYRDIDEPEHYELRQRPTADLSAFQTQLNSVTAGGGGDGPEDWFNGLRQLATDPTVFTRDGSRIVVLLGDAPPHFDCDNPAAAYCPRYPTRDQVVSALTGAGAQVLAIPLGTPSSLDAGGHATDIANATDGLLIDGSIPPDATADAIAAGIRDLPVTVTPQHSCDHGATVGFDPPGLTQRGGGQVSFAETVKLPADIRPGTTATCQVDFLFNGQLPEPRRTQHLTATAQTPGAPTVVVSGAVVTSPDGQPAPATFTATATDATGAPLTPGCDQTPGARYPVGFTTVTCTATDASGRTGSATAPLAVQGPGTGQGTGIWFSAVDQDTLRSTRQIPFTAKVNEPCANDGTAPAWSPDGQRLAYAHRAEHLCTANADGTSATRIVSATGPNHPEWTPDAAAILFDGDDDGRRAIWSVPPNGGDPVTLVSRADGAAHPTTRRLPDLAVTASASPPDVVFGGGAEYLFTITSTGLVTAPGAPITLDLPPGLEVDEVLTTSGSCRPDATRCTLGGLARGQRAEIRVQATATTAGEQTATATAPVDINPGDNTARAKVTVAEEVVPPANPGSLSLAVAAVPPDSYVGGQDVVLSYRMRNGSPEPMTDVRLVTALPPELGAPTSAGPGCTADGEECALGTLHPGQLAEVRLTLPARAATRGPAGGSVFTTGPDSDVVDNTAAVEVSVRQPRLTVDPPIGPPGFVARVVGVDFPPGAEVRLAWSAGVTQEPATARVGGDGGVDAQLLVFPRDRLGPRDVLAAPLTGPRFGQVASNPFLVVPRTVQPPDFVFRG
ncbi:WD40 domain protein beta Propeller [Actinosynnema mirum DSM 43827]|uniref:WD40 domain protein beta Propeller n=1 Tax=Actinosynnema mirum (strain ATCC 29888 / DSM 43827 / JCM 3225 / NBRC 14064 / NCIMB 13271 / NRRL B-12336 / IMRU 3971 / 101) TaxID=446462 RepID=C6WA08_ACTMD|nr:WD40 domain protein beta Propeller [Actinosynnema mirum DSM 43827]